MTTPERKNEAAAKKWIAGLWLVIVALVAAYFLEVIIIHSYPYHVAVICAALGALSKKIADWNDVDWDDVG